ncbi:MAG: dTMP kinase [Actinophytocola sp.]|nr:dTMP kinase [Actinophytocola sp.]
MGKLIVIEGLDGAGKHTLATALVTALRSKGVTVAQRSFPRYGQDVHADLIHDGLHGRLGDLTDSVNGMALLFALDRRAAAPRLRTELAETDVVLTDRYVASNAAYGAARLRQGADGEFVEWVRALEIDRFGVPVPDAHILLRVPSEVAAERAQRREAGNADRARDTYESNAELQADCARVYDQLAERGWLSTWHVVDGSGDIDADSLVAMLI